MTKFPSMIVTGFLIAFSLTSCSSKESENMSKALAAGELIVKNNCKVCHAQGINGAPIIGNSKMWSPRIEQGIPTLIEHATQGFGLMPPKGGNTELSNEDIELAVTYMVKQVNK